MALEPQMSKLMSRLEWTWRLVMTGLCFALFGLGGLLLSVVWFNILLVLVWDTSRRRRLARRSIAASFPKAKDMTTLTFERPNPAGSASEPKNSVKNKAQKG